nr:hypothetical protein [Tanacetum cinerariifolium]
MSIASQQATIASEEQLVPSANKLKITKNNQCVASYSNITDSCMKLAIKIHKHQKLYKPISLTSTMPPPISNKPFTKPPTRKKLFAFIKTLRYDEDPKETMTIILHFVATRLHQPWRAILSVLNRCLAGKDTSWDRARLLEPEEQHVSSVRRGRGKGYMCIGNQEVNISSKPKKAVVPRKLRTITVGDNIIEQEIVVVELAKSVSI